MKDFFERDRASTIIFDLIKKSSFLMIFLKRNCHSEMYFQTFSAITYSVRNELRMRNTFL